MPVKRRIAKVRNNRITPEAMEAFHAGDALALHRALQLRPWQPSPLDVDGPIPPADAGMCFSDAWATIWELRQQLEMEKSNG
jgi:hypothetical protein